MQFPKEQSDRCINVNLYSVIRCFYQNRNTFVENNAETSEPEAKRQKVDENTKSASNIQKKTWQLDNEKACKILDQKVDSLIITAKEHPVNITKELLSFLKGNRNFVVFSLFKELHQDLYTYLKTRTDIINIRITNNFMRNYQVLPNRTHPEVNMTIAGYLLTGYKLDM